MRTSITTASPALAAFFMVTVSLTAESLLDRPSGTIIFSSIAPRGWDLYVTDAQTRVSRRLTEHPALDYNAAFSPVGKRMAFVSERDGNLELYAIQNDGTGLKRLTTENALDDHPAWSPDGRRIAFSSMKTQITLLTLAALACLAFAADVTGTWKSEFDSQSHEQLFHTT